MEVQADEGESTAAPPPLHPQPGLLPPLRAGLPADAAQGRGAGGADLPAAGGAGGQCREEASLPEAKPGHAVTGGVWGHVQTLPRTGGSSLPLPRMEPAKLHNPDPGVGVP